MQLFQNFRFSEEKTWHFSSVNSEYSLKTSNVVNLAPVETPALRHSSYVEVCLLKIFVRKVLLFTFSRESEIVTYTIHEQLSRVNHKSTCKGLTDILS